MKHDKKFADSEKSTVHMEILTKSCSYPLWVKLLSRNNK